MGMPQTHILMMLAQLKVNKGGISTIPPTVPISAYHHLCMQSIYHTYIISP